MIGRCGSFRRMNRACRSPVWCQFERDSSLGRRKMTNLAIRGGRGAIVRRGDVDIRFGMVVMPEVRSHLDSLVLAIACRRSERCLERYQHQQEKGDEATHALKLCQTSR